MRVVANTKITQFYCSKNNYSCFWWKILVTRYIDPGTFKAPEKGFPEKKMGRQIIDGLGRVKGLPQTQLLSVGAVQ